MADFPRLALADVDSTNLEAMRRARAGEPGPLWITATTQNQGRGRLGREWVSEIGNLYATLLLRPSCPLALASGLGFVAALSLADCFEQLAPEIHFQLKWPNDVLANGGKIAGILIETELLDGQLCAAIGCGLNLNHFPSETRYPATSLKVLGAKTDPETAFAALNKSMAARLSEWDEGRGFASISQAWTQKAFHLGKLITLDIGSEMLTGRFNGLADDGAMLLELNTGEMRAIHAGEVRATQMPKVNS